MKLAILTPIHGKEPTRHLIQLANYLSFMAEADITFYYHFSLESSPEFIERFKAGSSSLTTRCRFCPRSRQTSINSAINALIETTRMLISDNWIPDKVYYHTDSDLLFTHKAINNIQDFEIGVGADTGSVLDKNKWVHYNAMMNDSRLINFFENELKAQKSKLIVGRTEGMFASYERWEQLFTVISRYFDDSFFDSTLNHWCIEEVIVPSLLLAKADGCTNHRSQLIYTKRNPPSDIAGPSKNTDPRMLAQNHITIQDIDRLRIEGRYSGAKWFSPEKEDPVYNYLKALTSKPITSLN